MSNLRSQGFRFVYRNGYCKWVHPAEVLPGDTDCTDMDDDAFERFILGDLFK